MRPSGTAATAPVLLVTLLLTLAGCPPASQTPDAGDDAGPGVECTEETAASDCDDGDPCTVDSCQNGYCTYGRGEPAWVVEGRIETRGPALGVELRGDRLHVAGETFVDTYRGLREIATMPVDRTVERTPSGPARRVVELDGQLFVSVTERGIDVFPADGPMLVSNYDGRDAIMSLGKVGRTVIASAFAKGIEWIVYDPMWQNPVRRTQVDTPGRAYDALAWRDRFLVADGLAGVSAIRPAEIDEGNPGADMPGELMPEERIDTEGRVVDVDRVGDLLALSESHAGLGLYDLQARQRLPSYDAGDDVLFADFLSRKTLIAAASSKGILLVDLMDLDLEAPDPAGVRLWTAIPVCGEGVDGDCLPGPALHFDRDGERLAVALGDAGVAVVNLACTPPEAP